MKISSSHSCHATSQMNKINLKKEEEKEEKEEEEEEEEMMMIRGW